MVNLISAFPSLKLTITALLLSRASAVSLTSSSNSNNGDQTDQTPAGADNSKFTYYNLGLTACGQTYADSDFVVALNETDFGPGYPGPHCFKQITVTYQGNQEKATVVDKCGACPGGGLDLSPSLFQALGADLGEGVIYGSWHYD